MNKWIIPAGLFFFLSCSRSRTDNGARIRFDQDTLFIGKVDTNSTKLIAIGFTNSGTDTLKIIEITSSCGCTEGVLSDSILTPGEKGSLQVKFTAGKKPERFSKHIVLRSNTKETFSIVHLIGETVDFSVSQ